MEIFEKNIVLSSEEQIIYTTTHKNKTSQLSKTVNFLHKDFNMTEGKTNKITTVALIANQEDNIAMITVNKAKVLIKNSIENYKHRKVDIQDEATLVIENKMASTENTALLSISYILQGYKIDSQKANEQITSAIKERYDKKVSSNYQVSGIPVPPGHFDHKTL